MSNLLLHVYGAMTVAKVRVREQSERANWKEILLLLTFQALRSLPSPPPFHDKGCR